MIETGADREILGGERQPASGIGGQGAIGLSAEGDEAVREEVSIPDSRLMGSKLLLANSSSVG